MQFTFYTEEIGRRCSKVASECAFVTKRRLELQLQHSFPATFHFAQNSRDVIRLLVFNRTPIFDWCVVK